MLALHLEHATLFQNQRAKYLVVLFQVGLDPSRFAACILVDQASKAPTYLATGHTPTMQS